MPIANIYDKRTGHYNINVDVVFEPSCHDSSIAGATKFDWTDEFTVDSMYNTTVAQAIEYAKQWRCPVTAYLYDVGSKPVG